MQHSGGLLSEAPAPGMNQQKPPCCDLAELPCSSSMAYLAQLLILLPNELHVIHILFLCFAVPLGRLQCPLHIDHALTILQARYRAGAASTLGLNRLGMFSMSSGSDARQLL